ncbi:phage tail protein I [Thermogemmatispora tikiterensis]|uniref:Phage tail protein I n=1 Tax=Thermogemmatispora tikiterensis TaxID=1825093 RepID=A0A328VII8_9CHLR|nr:phage tail protein I [Thermogemmatispora tikiterensis]RAQ97526.1 phage tail protein I [Thermogemmatispora tikiterensis]
MATPQIVVRLQGEVIKTVSLTAPVLRIGRGPESDLMLDHQIISRHHAELRLTPQGCILTDLGSSNGTLVGQQRLLPHQPYLLRDGASFQIGPYLITYEAEAGTAARLPAQAQTTSVGPDEGAKRAEEERLAAPVTPRPGGGEKGPVPERAATPPARLVGERPRVPAAPAAARPVRPATPVSSPAGPSIGGLYLRYLPDIYQESDFLQRFLHIFEDIWEPLEQRQDHIEMYFDPRTCPTRFLPWLASWLDIPLNPHWPEARQRRLLAEAWELYSWRGTLYGLKRMIEICTGLQPDIFEKPEEPFIFHVRVRLDPAADGEVVDRAFLEELIQLHKPAHAGYILEVIP